MKKWRLPRLSRGWKTVRNLTIAVLWLVLAWGIIDYPLPGPVAQFRRAERIDWVGPSDIQYVGKNYGVVGTYMDQVVIGTGMYNLDYWPRNSDGPTLVPKDGEFVAVDVPEGTARAELSMEAEFMGDRNACTVSGSIQKEGGILFLTPEEAEPYGPLDWASERESYRAPHENGENWAKLEAIFYDENGVELGRAVLNTPEGGDNFAD